MNDGDRRQGVSRTDEVFDHAGLLRRLCDDEDLVSEIIESYLQEVPQQISLLEGALAREDMDAAVLISHRLKGSSANVGACALQKVFGSLESAARKGCKEEAGGLMGRIRRQVEIFAGMFNDEKTFSPHSR